MQIVRNKSYHVNLNAMVAVKNLASSKKLVKDFYKELKDSKIDIVSKYPDHGYWIEIYHEKNFSSLKESLKFIKRLNKLSFKNDSTNFNISFSYSDGACI